MFCKKRAQETVRFARQICKEWDKDSTFERGREKRGRVTNRETCKGASSLIDSQQIICLSSFDLHNWKQKTFIYNYCQKYEQLAEVRVVFLFRLIIGFFFFPFVLPPLLLLLLLVRDKSQLTRFNKFCFWNTRIYCVISLALEALQRPRDLG